MGNNWTGLVGYSFKQFLRHKVNGSILLMLVAALAMVAANSPFADLYHRVWQLPISLQVGDFNFLNHHGSPLTLMQFINDALMAIFFLSVGLEIKRELLVGELSSFNKSMLPIIAAVGGMIFPVGIYYFITQGTDAVGGMAIPMATDIAFSLGVLSLFGARVPICLKVFLTAFAVVDDIGGILIIAIFYSSHISFFNLLLAAFLLLVLVVCNKMGVKNLFVYLFTGVVVWYLFMQSGVHSTIAGVLLAFTIPAKPSFDTNRYIGSIKENLEKFSSRAKQGIILSHEQIDSLRRIEASSNNVISPLQAVESRLHSVIDYFIMPVFAFANAGITFTGGASIEMGTVAWAIVLGLFVGKSVGIFLFAFFAIKCRVSSMPSGMEWKNLIGVAFLGGIGFTVSLFISNLSFNNSATAEGYFEQAKLGVLMGTVVSGLVGYLILNKTLPKKKE